MKKSVTWLLIVTSVLSLGLTGCGSTKETASADAEDNAYVDVAQLEDIEIFDEAVALSESPVALTANITTEHPGKSEKKNDKATIDYSNTAEGYVMVCYTATTDKRLKVQVAGPSTTYTYNINQGQWATFPLSDGNGSYKVSVYRKASDDANDKKYSNELSVSFTATMKNEFAPYLYPNQYVDYSVAPETVKKAQELAGSETDALKKVEKVYDFVISNFTYDKDKAATVKSGYLPVLDNVLSVKKGICFDYAAVMTGMLRSQGVPCKLVVGYAGEAYHAWISVYSSESGWVEGAIFFDGTAWQRMDPTFASSGKSSASIMKYIGDGSHYTAKYFY